MELTAYWMNILLQGLKTSLRTMLAIQLSVPDYKMGGQHPQPRLNATRRHQLLRAYLFSPAITAHFDLPSNSERWDITRGAAGAFEVNQQSLEVEV